MSNTIPMLDLMFFLTESQDSPRHVGAVQIFRRPRRGGAGTVRGIVDAYRCAKPRAPFNRVPVFRKVGLPEWREVHSVDMNHHVIHLALPAPGSDEQLHRLIADLHAPMLDRDRPGWKLYVIEGLAGDRFALYYKVHHALVDGEAGMDVLRQSLSDSAQDRHIKTTFGVRRRSQARLAPHGMRETLEREAQRLARRSQSLGRGSVRLAEETVQGLLGFSRSRKRSFTAPDTPMNEALHNSRVITHTTFPLQSMKAIAKAWDATLNDVALCIIDAGINRYLKKMGRTPDHPLVSLCPVSLHDPDVKVATTLVSVMWPELGSASASIGKRMTEINANTRAAKAKLLTLGKDAAYAYAVLSFALTETLVIAQPEHYGLRPANVLISNVRGPEKTLYLNGARLEAMFPVSTFLGGIGLNITFISYDGEVIMGFVGNGSALPEVESMARYTQQAFAALERVTARRPR